MSRSRTEEAEAYERLVGASKSYGSTETGDRLVDPFTPSMSFTAWEYLKVAVNTLWLFPLRLFLIVLPTVVMGCLVCLFSILFLRFDENNPQPLMGWRKCLLQTIGRKVDRLFLLGFGFHWIKTKGRMADTHESPILLVAPHSSMLDMFIIGLYQVPTYVSRLENRGVPLFGTLITRALNTIYVSREEDDSRQRAMEEIKRRANSGGQWPKVLIFPEGTTTNTKRLLTFKKGSFTLNLPVQAAVIKFKNRINPMVWGDNGHSLVASLFLTLCQFHNSLEVEFLPVYYPSEEEKADAVLFAENVRQQVSSATGIPTTDCSFEDLLLGRSAKKLGIPFSSGLTGYSKARRELGVGLDEMKKHLKRFAAMDSNKDGLVCEEDMAGFLQVPIDPSFHSFFSSFKQTSSSVSFSNYLHGLLGPTQTLLEDEYFMKKMFESFDADGDGVLSGDEVPKLPAPFKANKKDQLDFEDFKLLMSENLELVLLFRHCHSQSDAWAGVDTPPLMVPALQ